MNEVEKKCSIIEDVSASFDSFINSGNHEAVIYVGKQLSQLIDEVKALTEPDIWNELESVVHINCGLAYLNKGDLISAETFCRMGTEESKKVMEDDDNAENLNWLALSYSSLGDVSNKRGKRMEAVKYYKAAISFDKMAIQSDFCRNYKDQLECDYTKLGDVYRDMGNQWEAWDCYDECDSIKREYALQDAADALADNLAGL